MYMICCDIDNPTKYFPPLTIYSRRVKLTSGLLYTVRAKAEGRGRDVMRLRRIKRVT